MVMSIAVLPLQNMSSDPEQEYFADGVSDEIRNLLAHIRPLNVIARTSSSSFKGKSVDIPTIAAQLNSRYILEGSVRTNQDRVRITAELIDSLDGTHIWSHTYDRDLSAEDLFYIQSDVARAITDELRLTLTAGDEERLAKVPTENTEAYEAYLLGRHWLADRKVEELGKAATQFARAIELDPNFAGAYSGLADACVLYAAYSGGHIHEVCPKSTGESYRADVGPLARKAVELDAESGDGWISLGVSLAGEAAALANENAPAVERASKLKEAHAAFERGLSLNPSHVQGYLWYAMSLGNRVLYGDTWIGWLDAWKADTWQSVVKRGLEIDPLSIPLHSILGDYPVWAGSKDEALFHANRIVEIAPDSPKGYQKLGDLSWNLSGRIDEAIKWEAGRAKVDPDNPGVPEMLGYAYATLGDIDMAIAYLERAAQMYPEDMDPGHFAGWRAKFLLGSKNNLQPDLIFELLQQLHPRDYERLEAEAQLAIIGGNAAEWLSSREDELRPCLNAEIDEFYVDGIGCEVWLDRVLQLTGNEQRALAAIKQRMKVSQIWLGDWPYKKDSYREYAKYYAMLGKKDEALDYFEKLVRSGWRGNPYHSYPGILLRFVLYHDTTLDSIRDQPRFQALVAEVEADLAQQLENVRALERNGELPTLELLRAEAIGK